MVAETEPLLPAMVGAATILFSMATSDPGADVGPCRVAVAAALFAVAVVWFAVRARLNESAARVLHPGTATPPEEKTREQAAEAQRYALLLHGYATEPPAVVERLPVTR